MERCYSIYKNSKKQEHKASAVELLRVIADRRAIKWIADFLNDPNETIQNWGIGVVDQLSFAGRVFPEEIMPLLNSAENHKNEYVKEVAKKIKDRLKDEIQ